MTDKKYVEIRFRLPVEDFEIYKQEAEKAQTLGYNISVSAQIKAEVIKQAEAKRQLQSAVKQSQPKKLTALEELELSDY